MLAQDPIAALVRIYATHPGVHGCQIGSGVFIDAKGTVLTAYHVVQGAQSVEVFGPKGGHGAAKLEAYSEDADLATISIPAAPAIAFLPVSAAPGGLTKLSGKVYGNPDGKGSGVTAVNFSRDTTFPSENYPRPDGRKPFAIEDIALFGLEGTLNKGLSGAPVLVNGRLVGIVGGSEAPQGKKLGWAISVSNLNRLKPSNAAFSTLPPLRLLSGSDTGSLLKSALPAARQERLTQLLEAAHNSAAQEERLRQEWAQLLPQVDRALGALPGGSSSLDKRLAAVTQANQLLDFGTKLNNAYTAFENDVRLSFLSEIPKESATLTKLLQTVETKVRELGRERQKLLPPAQKKGAPVKKGPNNTRQLAELDLKLEAANRMLARYQKVSPTFELIQSGATASAVDVQAPLDTARNASLAYGKSAKQEILSAGPMPTTLGVFRAWKASNIAVGEVFRTDLQNMQPLVGALDTIIDFYTSPEAAEF